MRSVQSLKFHVVKLNDIWACASRPHIQNHDETSAKLVVDVIADRMVRNVAVDKLLNGHRGTISPTGIAKVQE